VLPYDFAVDWREYCVWVDQSDVHRIGEKVAAHYDSLTDAQFVELQRACRRFWETMLSPEGFFQHFDRHLNAARTPRPAPHGLLSVA
jgi:hypothetical protein